MSNPELRLLLPLASAELCEILAPSWGFLQPPIRSEIFGQQRFAQHGRSLGETHRAERASPMALLSRPSFFPRLRSNIRALRAAHRYIGQQASTGYDISPAAEWLLDNFHLIEAQLKEIHEGLPSSYFRALPLLQDEPLAGLPRIYGVAWAFVAHTDGAFDEELLKHYLIAYQESRELKLSEMWALPTTLRVVLVENLRRLAERVATNKAAREVANLAFERINAPAGLGLPALQSLLKLLSERGVGRVFLTQLAQRLQDRHSGDEFESDAALDAWLHQGLPDLAAMQAQQTADQTADNLSVSNAVNALRAIGDADWADIVAGSSSLMRLMLSAPSFEQEHVSTRDQTLHAIELLARRSGRTEMQVAQHLLDLMRGSDKPELSEQDRQLQTVASHWLRGSGRPILLRAVGMAAPGVLAQTLRWRVLRRFALPVYLAALVSGSLGLVAWLLPSVMGGNFNSGGWLWWLTAGLMCFPASEAVVALINRLISESARPELLPRLALAQGIPAEQRVLVVIPAMFSDAVGVKALVHRLHLHYLANPECQAQFALLSDWSDAALATSPSDAGLLDLACRLIADLNTRHAQAASACCDAEAAQAIPRFIILHRARAFSTSEQRWIGWERKRGKLEMLVETLALGVQTTLDTRSEASGRRFLDLGELSRLASGHHHILTLDSDTQLPPGRLRELVGVAAHPHNRPQLDAAGRQVLRGYGILQPQVLTPLPAPADFTLYHWLFAGQCGIDPYSAASSEVYQDLFHEGSFSGKGLLHVQTLHALLSGRLPEGQVLSHDLLEGSIARCAAVMDISVVEDAPFHADVAASRVHRWTRGDWQLLPFLFNPWRYPSRPVNRWKMFDNLRRSLVAPMSLALLVLALAGTGLSPWTALGLVLAAFLAGPLMGALAGFSPSRVDVAKLHFYRQAGLDLARALIAGLWLLGQLLQQALLASDAVLRALYRMAVSRRHLLQWTTAAQAQAAAKTRLPDLLRAHALSALLAFGLLAGLLLAGTPTPLLSVVLCLFWASAGLSIWWVSAPRPACDEASLAESDRLYLLDLARDTWRYFERSVGPDDLFLPPDNLQTAPHEMLARRTSPTNIGLYLLSVACAREFGWIGTQELLERLQATLSTMRGLQRHRGHFLNWYGTQDGAPLLPMYVSAVDSGNLCAHLLTVAQACLALAEQAGGPHEDSAARQALQRCRERLAPLLAARTADTGPDSRAQLRWCLADYRATKRSAERDRWAAAEQANMQPKPANQALRELAQAFEAMAGEAEFGFLYHRKRHLFHIGYRVADQQLDAGFFDLLASEARLTSLLAVAKGDVPVRHWAALGRPFFAADTAAGLRSWSGSMFEYLMPGLVLDEPHGSVLRDACLAALHEQIAFAQGQDAPWGISESAYAERDNSLAYQYAPQGVPRLALRRTPPDELVIAPYATALAAPLAPQLACQNFAALELLQARGRYGFIEALDYSPARQATSLRYTPVLTFMAHHQGMSIVALCNVLADGAPRRWGMAIASLEAVSSLLHERPPREVSKLYEPPPALAPQALRLRGPGLLREVLPGANAVEPTHLLSNGRYSVALRANGAGWSRWGDIGLTRWRDDLLRDAYGSFFYLRWAAPSGEGLGEGYARQPLSGPLYSITQHPAPDAAAQYHSNFHADRVSFEASWGHLQTQATVWVSPEDDIEFRQVELRNLSDEAIEIELISSFELSLTNARAEQAHPAFANLFVRAEWQAEQQALLFERTPRLVGESRTWLAHFLTEVDGDAGGVQGMRWQTDRQRWLGRNHLASAPLADFGSEGSTESTELQTGLDPVCTLARRLRIAPQGKARLTFATAAADSRATLHAVIDKYRQASNVQRASLMSATLTGIRLRNLRLDGANFAAIQLFSTALALHLTRPSFAIVDLEAAAAGAPSSSRGADRRRNSRASASCDRRLLWRFGISGDKPIILVNVGVPLGLGLLRTLAKALRIWGWGGLACDLVVINAELQSYEMSLQRELAALTERHRQASAADPGPAGAGAVGFHVLRAAEISPAELSTLQQLACLRLHADGRPLKVLAQDWADLHEEAFDLRHAVSSTVVGLALPLRRPLASTEPAFQGEFVDGGAEFAFKLQGSVRPQRPWINVLANASFGAQVSESGAGYSWAQNSRLNQLTAWSNDPVADPPAELLLVQDLQTLKVWSLTPNAWSDQDCEFEIQHGQGHSRISHSRGGLDAVVSWCVDSTVAVKQVRVQLQNRGRSARRLRVIGLVEWKLGGQAADRATVNTYVLSRLLAGPPRQLTALLATQKDHAGGFGEGTAFWSLCSAPDEADSDRETVDWSCDRREFFDARGRLIVPDYFGKSQGAGLDPCAALATRVLLAVGGSQELVFQLGYGTSPEAACELALSAATKPAEHRQQEVAEHWQQLLGATQVKTPDPLFDAMVNRWLLYQTVACRLWAKAGFYQAGGATGFRDQLQDAMALAWAAPAQLRAQIVLCAGRQFAQGDVQHWWHMPSGAGVRTHFSDDLLWLPYACVHYLRRCGDTGLLDERVSFLEGPEIPEGAEDAYFVPTESAQKASVYEHAARSIDHSLRVGTHGLPLMGSGDWNDGMNRVGEQGRGESVWLAWFLCSVVQGFAPLARRRGEIERAEIWEQAAAGWQAALLSQAWDGAWFKRAFFDDGQPLGSQANAQGRIDLIAQAWAVLSQAAPPELQRQAMASADQLLVDTQGGLIRLLDPPLQDAVPNAGYIQAYPPGVRENGGQYTHAGVWGLMAQAQLASQGEHSQAQADAGGDQVYRYFGYLSPAHRMLQPAQAAVYGLEPYAVAGDVYSQAPYRGRGGWSWYTGAAAWLHRAAIESMFGLQMGEHSLSFAPCLPSHWPQAEMSLRRDALTLRFVLLRSAPDQALAHAAALGVAGARLLAPGQQLAWSGLSGTHCFVVPLLREGVAGS